MIIKNVNVYGEDRQFHHGEVSIENGVFTEHAASEKTNGSVSDEVIDGEGCYCIPGLIDLHFHGCVGADVCDGTQEALETIADYEASIGVTTICPATMTLSVEQLEQILSNAAAYPNAEGARLVGLNMEGPFISEAKKGAQDAQYIIPCDAEIYRRFQKAAGGLVKIIGIAPETDVENAVKFVSEVKEEVTVSLAHTNADYDSAKAAYDAGARHAVHLFNAMPAFTHRAPGVVGAARDCKDCMAELICDGVHIHPSMVRAAFSMFGEDRIIMISDSMRATGMPDGRYTLGGQDVDVVGNRATLVSDGALAGSATNLMDCLRTAVKTMEIPLETAVLCTTLNPAKALHLDDRYGSIAPGKIGNVVLLDQDLNLKKVFINL